MDEALTRARIAADGHRGVVGGMWDVIGPLQLDFLIAQGLTPDDRVLDLGCGALRGGVHLVRHLAPGRYYGVDISPALIEAGYEKEIRPLGLQERLPRSNLAVVDDFAPPFGVTFDIGLAVSLFTHLPLDQYTAAMAALTPHFRTGGRFFASFWEGGAEVLDRGEGIFTYADRDSFHFPREALAAATPPAWAFRWIGDWSHPRGQQIAELTRL